MAQEEDHIFVNVRNNVSDLDNRFYNAEPNENAVISYFLTLYSIIYKRVLKRLFYCTTFVPLVCTEYTYYFIIDGMESLIVARC